MSQLQPDHSAALFDLTGRRALVTGASRGIGRAIALGLAAHGAEVAGVARSEKGLVETVALSHGLRGSVRAVTADLGTPESIRGCLDDVLRLLGGLDVLVNNAGLDNESTLADTTLEDWSAVHAVNVQSVFLMCQAAASHLADGGGKVINVASMFGLVGVRAELAYVTSKHAVIGLTKAVALEWARKDVQVNALCPGFVATDMLVSATDDEATAAYLRRTTPIGRWAEVEEMVGPAVFLASAASSFMTGQVLVVDGGYTAQ